MFKNRLQEYAQKNSLPLPIYDVVNDGEDHRPQFKCSVTVNGTKYDSPLGFIHKKEAENAAAQGAIEDLLQQGFKDVEFQETNLSRNFLDELASMKNAPLPTYEFTKEGDAHFPTYTATVYINGASYTGAPGNNKKAAARKAAYEAIRSICLQDCISIPQPELFEENKQNNDFKQPSEEWKVIESVSKMLADNSTSNCQLLVGEDSHSADNNTEEFSVENAHALENVPEKIKVGEPCLVGQGLQKSMVKDSSEVENDTSDANAGSAPVEEPQHDPILVNQLHRVKEEGRGLYKDTKCESEKLEGKRHGSPVVLMDSIVKRSKGDYENAEQMSQRKKKSRRKRKAERKNDGTA